MATKSKKSKTKKASAKTKKRSSTNASSSRLDPETKLKVVANPFKPGSVRHKWAELVGKSATVADFLKKGGAGNYLSWLVRNGNVKTGS
jgi:hypothetical protein